MILDINARQQYIEKFVVRLYDKFPELFPEDLNYLKRTALEKFLYSDLSLDEISEIMCNVITDRQAQLQRRKEEEKQRHYDLNDLFDCRISHNCLHIHVVPKSVREDMVDAGGPTKYLNDVVAPKLDDALEKVSKILRESEKEVTSVAAISPTLRLAQNLFGDRGFTVGETNEPRFVEMFGQSKIFKATIPREKLIKLVEEKNRPVQEVPTEPIVAPVVQEPVQVVATQVPVVNEELNAMVEESNKVEKVESKEKQFVKKDNNKESGVISLFNISLSICVITTMILIAMILNVLLK